LYERWVLFIIIVTALAGCIGEKEPVVNATNVTQVPTQPPPHVVFPVQEPSTVYVEIFGGEFIPPVHKVINGTTVRWTNRDSATYVITGKGFRSPELNKWGIWNHTFNETGIFEYNCSNHPSIPHGRIIVELPPHFNNS
jgi:plastocyanin